MNGSAGPPIHNTFYIWCLHSDLRRDERLSGVKSADVDSIEVQQRQDNMEKSAHLFGIHGKWDQVFAACSMLFKMLVVGPMLGMVTWAGQKVHLATALSDQAGRSPGELSAHMSVQLKKPTHIASISCSIFIITFLSSFMHSSPPTCGHGSSSPLLAARQRVYAGAALFMQNVRFYLCFLLLALCLATITHIILLAWEALPFPCQPHAHTLSKHLHADDFIYK